MLTFSRVALLEMLPSSEIPEKRSLFEVCQAALKRFSTSSLGSNSPVWDVSEAALQAEMFRCLMLELSYRFIQPELTKDRSGRVDFFIPDKKWGVELLRYRAPEEILTCCGRFADRQDQHAGYFNEVGKYMYAGWNNMDDYIIINFCRPNHAKDLTDNGPFFFLLIA